MKDLFGNKVTEEEVRELLKKRKRNSTPSPNGYAALPGTGPAGETCKTCKHIVRLQFSKTYLKCGLVARLWTHTTSTDVRARAPACRNWEKPDDR